MPSYEKSPSFKVIACSVLELWAIYWAGGGKHSPPLPVLIGLNKIDGLSAIFVDHTSAQSLTVRFRPLTGSSQPFSVF